MSTCSGRLETAPSEGPEKGLGGYYGESTVWWLSRRLGVSLGLHAGPVRSCFDMKGFGLDI